MSGDTARPALPTSILDPANTALLVVDVQNDFIHADGRSGVRSDGNADFRAMVDGRLAPFVEEARALGVRVVWIQMENAPDTVSPANARIKRKMYGTDPDDEASVDIWERAVCVRGSWGAEIYLPVAEDDIVSPKSRYSAFIRTELDGMLRELGVTTTAVAGVVTNQCVESTARDAYQHDYDVLLVADCVAERSPEARTATFANIEGGTGWVRDSADLLAAWHARVGAIAAGAASAGPGR
jgi:ureidoacrylate peracid hydrolase